MIIRPRVRGFICTTAHPAGCEANVREQIEYVKSKGPIPRGPRTALVIGASSGYGLAARITAAFGCGASSLGVYLERGPEENRPASAGWYNSAAFDKFARGAGLYSAGINGDAFSPATKSRAVALLKKELGPVDLLVYSLAAPARTDPVTGETIRSVLKPLKETYVGKTLDTDKGTVRDVRVEPAGEKETRDTVAVMGGRDWMEWMRVLDDEDLVGEACTTVAFSYVGSRLTRPIYWDGTIGEAKKDLERAAGAIGETLARKKGSAYVCVLKALVTQSSAAIPVVPLYISVLYKVMKEKGTHEGCVEQMQRMFATRLYGDGPAPTDEKGRIRMDELELSDDVQRAVAGLWPLISTENVRDLTDFDGYRADFLRLFGFGLPGVDYEADVDPAAAFD